MYLGGIAAKKDGWVINPMQVKTECSFIIFERNIASIFLPTPASVWSVWVLICSYSIVSIDSKARAVVHNNFGGQIILGKTCQWSQKQCSWVCVISPTGLHNDAAVLQRVYRSRWGWEVKGMLNYLIPGPWVSNVVQQNSTSSEGNYNAS